MSSMPAGTGGPWPGWRAPVQQATGPAPSAIPHRAAPPLDPSLFLPPAAQASAVPGSHGFAAQTFASGSPSVVSMLPAPPGGGGAGHAFRRSPTLPAWGAAPVAEGPASAGAAPLSPTAQGSGVPFRAVPATVPPIVRPARPSAQQSPWSGAFVPFR